MKDEGGQAEHREVQDKAGAAGLLEEHEEPDQQINKADQIDVEIARRPVLDRVQIVEVRDVKTRLLRKRRPFDAIMQMPADTRLFEINLNVRGRNELFIA